MKGGEKNLAWFRKQKVVETRESEVTVDPVLSAIIYGTEIDMEKALNIPTVSGGIELITNIVASVPIKLYKEDGVEVTEVTQKELEDSGDYRLKLLNDETGDLLNAYQMKKAFIRDYLLNGNGYIYINRVRNSVKSLHYVEESKVSVTQNVDPIFKKVDIVINGTSYLEFDLIKLTRNTVNGVTGKGIIQENPKLLSVAYNSLKFEEALVKTGGNKKGFLKAQHSLAEPVMEALKSAWKRLYSNNDENVVILNNGLEFQEASNTSVEMQLNENKKTNADEICKILNMSVKVLDGTASDQEQSNFIKNAIVPVLNAFATALNKDLLLETEKGSFYYAFDCKELMKGDIEKLFRAYQVALQANFMQLDEVRYELDLKPLGMNFIKLGLQDVLLDPKTNTVYTPNTNATASLSHMKGGEKTDESGNQIS